MPEPTPGTPEAVYRAALARLDEARRRLDAALIASAHLLEKPFTNAPETSPWERSVKPAMYALRRAVAAVRADVDAAYAAVIATRGAVSDAELAAFKSAGFDDAAALEVVLGVSLATLCNFANNLSQNELNPQLAAYRWAPKERAA